MALSTYVPLADTLAAERSAANRDVPIFMAHGTAGPDDPARARAASRELLERWAIRWSGTSTRCRTRCAPQEIDDIGAWLRRVLG